MTTIYLFYIYLPTHLSEEDDEEEMPEIKEEDEEMDFKPTK